MSTNRPVLIYDDKCSSCTLFAKYSFQLSRGQIDCVGHYSSDGVIFRKLIFPPNYNETEMFWLITPSKAYGGRSGLLPLLGLIIKVSIASIVNHELFPPRTFFGYCLESAKCNDKKFIIKRLLNLLRTGKKLNIKFAKPVKG